MKYSLLFLLALSLALNGCAIANKMSGVSQAKELSTTGEAAQAEILKVWDTGMTINDDPVVGFLLEVHPEGKDSYQAETKLRISRVSVPQVQPGALVPVRIDPANPQRVSLDIYEFKK
jgi:hypothetical protein